MAAGPSKAAVRSWLYRARKKAAEYAHKYNVQCEPYIMYASNGEAWGAYRVTNPRTNVTETVLSIENKGEVTCTT